MVILEELVLATAQRIDLVGHKLLFFSFLHPPRSLNFYKNSCDMGNWVAHPSSTTATKILVIYFLVILLQLPGESSPEPLASGRTSR
jgi:hypothetical protein